MHTHTHAHIHAHSSHLAPRTPRRKKYTLPNTGRQGCAINHAFTTSLHTLLSHTFILPCSTHIQHFSRLPFVTCLSISHLSLRILLFPSSTHPPPLSPCPNTLLCSTSQILFSFKPHFSLSPYALLHTYSSNTSSLLHSISYFLLVPYSSVFQPHIMHWAQLLLHTTFSLH